MEQYHKLKEQNSDPFSICKQMQKDEVNMIERIRILRELFPELNLLRAKEIDIISSEEYGSLNEYQKDIIEKIISNMPKDF